MLKLFFDNRLNVYNTEYTTFYLVLFFTFWMTPENFLKKNFFFGNKNLKLVSNNLVRVKSE